MQLFSNTHSLRHIGARAAASRAWIAAVGLAAGFSFAQPASAMSSVATWSLPAAPSHAVGGWQVAMPRLPIGGQAEAVAPRLRPYLPELRGAAALFLGPRMEAVGTPWLSTMDPVGAVHAAVFERPSRLALPASSDPLRAARPAGSADSLVLALGDAMFGATPSERVLGATRLIEPLLGASAGTQPIRFASADSSLHIDRTSDTAPAGRGPWGMLMGGAALFAFSVHRRISTAT